MFHPASRPLVLLAVILCLPGVPQAAAQEGQPASLEEAVAGARRLPGLLTLYWKPREGRVLAELPNDAGELLHVVFLRTGLGSSEVGLDRSQLRATRVVEFRRVGPRVLLMQRNLRHRALTEDPHQRRAVEESFPDSVLWCGRVVAEKGPRVLVDLTPYLLREDAGALRALARSSDEDAWSVDEERSVVDPERLASFPDNTELEALLGLARGKKRGRSTVQAPADGAPVLRVHHSFVRLPDEGYRPRPFDPRCGYFAVRFQDLAAPLGEPLQQAWIRRHRLRHAGPEAGEGPAVEPLVYYVDRAIPEPLRGAVLEGAGWWERAFEAAGFPGSFEVKLLPEDADPLDVRYNVIQWVHRATRGWSYGSSVTDPRTGEIIKGHVLLGSLRARRDHLLFDGLVPRDTGCCWAQAPDPSYLEPFLDPGEARDLTLARIRQLAAHEVGHTLGLAHNFAASTYGRASVMDYPAPLVSVDEEEGLDVSRAYAEGVGAWDVWVIRYGYGQPPPGVEENAYLEELIQEALERGLRFVADRHARDPGSAHPLGSLWDNGTSPVSGLFQALEVRRVALEALGASNLPEGRPLSELEDVFVPLYLHHRFAVAACCKLLGGVDFTYAVRGDGQTPATPVLSREQRKALSMVLRTLEPGELAVPERLLRLIPPPAAGSSRDREDLPAAAGPLLDPERAAAAAADITLSALLHPRRVSRLALQRHLDPGLPDLQEVLQALRAVTFNRVGQPPRGRAIAARAVGRTAVTRLIATARDARTSPEARARIHAHLRELAAELEEDTDTATMEGAHHADLAAHITRYLARPWPEEKPGKPPRVPPGEPIGR